MQESKMPTTEKIKFSLKEIFEGTMWILFDFKNL